MKTSNLSRRDFERLTLAAFGGLVAGCQKPEAAKPEAAQAEAKNPLLEEPHVCRGLNTCKGHGSDTCAGLSATASVKEHHCGGSNECKGQGGCGQHPGENACKGQGGCSIPLMSDEVWAKTRARFEELMTKEGRKFGPAPPKKDA
jgi:hypothetical protein